MKRIFGIACLVLLAAALWSGAALAQDPQPTPSDNEVNAVAKQLFCPVCENTPLDVCPTQACAQWRELIREQLAAGKTEAEIKDYFVVQYGARVLSEPPRSGLNWLVYIVPPIGILIGVIILISAFRSMRANAVAAAAEEAAPSVPTGDDYVARLEEELKKRKQ
jgi:cytochrome c-type biogenesis protein CcmH